MDAGLNAHWLMNYRVVALVNQCRRLIRDEFNVRLSLTDQALRTKLEHYTALSKAPELSRLMGEIAARTGTDDSGEIESSQSVAGTTETHTAADPPEPARRMYRGQPVSENAPPPAPHRRSGAADGADSDAPRTDPQTSRKGGGKVVYRGRVIRD
ncbi:hypothetical protein [Alloalcanivorax mobilis]|uniref:hypothetical protein n=1 Tax=Alloalcanivorax mobilis TaxID=2019569 RepID=UPI000C75F056|nr:hypothetical protein [Alloalcanivorax mobilis]